MDGKEAIKRLEKQYKRQNDYIKNSYDRISITLPKGTKDRIKATGNSINSIVNTLVLEWLQEHETGEPEPDPISTEPEEPEQIDTLPDDAWQLPFM